MFEAPSGAYIKDIDNAFIPYIGTWQGIWDNKIFIIKIEKIAHRLRSFPSGHYYYEDRLIAKYEIKNASNDAIIESNMDILIEEEAKISNIGTGKDNQMYFLYSDQNLCSNSGEILLQRNLSNLNQLSYFYFHDEFWLEENCPYERQEDIPIPIPIPTINLLLTKVN